MKRSGLSTRLRALGATSLFGFTLSFLMVLAAHPNMGRAELPRTPAEAVAMADRIFIGDVVEVARNLDQSWTISFRDIERVRGELPGGRLRVDKDVPGCISLRSEPYRYETDPLLVGASPWFYAGFGTPSDFRLYCHMERLIVPGRRYLVIDIGGTIQPYTFIPIADYPRFVAEAKRGRATEVHELGPAQFIPYFDYAFEVLCNTSEVFARWENPLSRHRESDDSARYAEFACDGHRDERTVFVKVMDGYAIGSIYDTINGIAVPWSSSFFIGSDDTIFELDLGVGWELLPYDLGAKIEAHYIRAEPPEQDGGR